MTWLEDLGSIRQQYLKSATSNSDISILFEDKNKKYVDQYTSNTGTQEDFLVILLSTVMLCMKPQSKEIGVKEIGMEHMLVFQVWNIQCLIVEDVFLLERLMEYLLMVVLSGTAEKNFSFRPVLVYSLN